MPDRIVLCEPQCSGFEHEHFNAAFLLTVLLAYPDAEVLFLAEADHLQRVRAFLESRSIKEARRVTWQTISIPARRSEGWERFKQEFGWLKSARSATKTNDALLVLCSISVTGLFLLKWRMRLRLLCTPVLAVLHGQLLTPLLQPPPACTLRWKIHALRKPWHRIVTGHHTLSSDQPEKLRYLVLGEPVMRNLLAILPSLAPHLSSIDHPYFPISHAPASEANANTVRFGYFGTGGKGATDFCALAAELRKQTEQAEFWLVGFMPGTEDATKLSANVQPPPKNPLSFEEYAQRAHGLTYAIGLMPTDRYHLSASASFLDALSFGKPGIYLRNDYIEHYFQILGDIGYLCDNLEQVQNIVAGIAREFPTERYKKQCKAIAEGRKMFEPDSLAGNLRNTIDRTTSNSRGKCSD